MSARRALTEPMEVGFAVEVACARRATPSPALVDDTLSSVRSSSRRAIAAPLSFEPDEPLDSTRPLPKVTVGGPQQRRSTSRLQRSLLSIAAAATAGAALIVPSLSSQVTAAEVISTPAAAVSTPVSRQAERPELVTPVTEDEAVAAEQARLAEEARLAEQSRQAAQAAAAQSTSTSQSATAATVQTPVVSGSASGTAQGAVSFALAQVGKAYEWGATGPDAYDCSGLMVAAYQSVGVGLPRTSDAMMSAGYAVSYADLQPGDLIISYGGGHVGMYIGNGQMVHSSTYGVGVIVSSLSGYTIDAMRRVA